MVEIEKIRADFSRRLHQACNLAGVRERGRAVDIQAELKRRGVKASTTAIGKWLNGESIPEPDKLIPLSDWLGVRPEWLEYGRGDSQKYQSGGVAETGGTFRMPPDMQPVHPFQGMPILGFAAASPPVNPDQNRKDDEVSHHPKPILEQIFRARSAFDLMDENKAEALCAELMGRVPHAADILLLFDAILQAALCHAMDLGEIRALTTMLKKMRNEKVHGITKHHTRK
ncbi:hypothetical protein [Pseudomonas sp. LP_4_YM]|uniref:hypothetical protein n=1 Tax=Pseudomonas sp. LP_4_YM TaxID=2485135 RepID=UPI00104CADFD|nr:hypothetical protein [Pseudomonas sp. LP_4_YM]TCT93314.1 hypothetical protein EC913_116133 [Pseudomonas sp. LP_4_YM]